jgi:hypothetical protein
MKRLVQLYGLIFLALLAWSLRFERPEFRAWEHLKDPQTPYFFPSRRVEMTEIGDLGYRAWIPSLQFAHENVMTTDRYGFRNPEDLPQPIYAVLGDSFVAGAGLSDEETIAAQLTKIIGAPTYSIACEIDNSPSLYLSEDRFLEHPVRAVIFAPNNRLIGPLDMVRIDRTPAESEDPRAAAELRKLLQTLGRDNGLSRSMRFGYNELRYQLFGHPDVIWPEGQPALALSLAEQKCHATPDQRYLDATIDSLLKFEELIARKNVKLVYAPVPDSAEVYPELFPGIETCAKPSLFDRLVPEARARGIVAIDLREVFRANKTPYLYRRDDSHWTPRAVGLAARAIAETLARLDLPQQPQ